MKILVTGGAGYIGAALVAHLICRGEDVIVLDELWFGGEALLPFFCFQRFQFVKGDVCQDDVLRRCMEGVDYVVHLAAVVGFPACAEAASGVVWRINVDGTKKVYEAACRAGVKRMIFASTYSTYGEAEGGALVTEESPLHPKSLYAESKIEAERFLINRRNSQEPAPVCLRLATVFGLSPRMRFDLILNQFVLEAYSTGRLILYQQDFRRTFVHVQDVVRAITFVLDEPKEKVQNQVFNVGSESLNTSKQEVALLVAKYLPGTRIEFADKTFAYDMRSIHVSFRKIREVLQFETKIDLHAGIEELIRMLRAGVIREPRSAKYYNHAPLVG